MALRLATFNLKDFFAPSTEAEKRVSEAKIANVAANLRRANADVVALQEVGSVELLDRLVTKELPELGYAAPVVGTADKRGIRNAILALFKLGSMGLDPVPRLQAALASDAAAAAHSPARLDELRAQFHRACGFCFQSQIIQSTFFGSPPRSLSRVMHCPR